MRSSAVRTFAKAREAEFAEAEAARGRRGAVEVQALGARGWANVFLGAGKIGS